MTQTRAKQGSKAKNNAKKSAGVVAAPKKRDKKLTKEELAGVGVELKKYLAIEGNRWNQACIDHCVAFAKATYVGKRCEEQNVVDLYDPANKKAKLLPLTKKQIAEIYPDIRLKLVLRSADASRRELSNEHAEALATKFAAKFPGRVCRATTIQSIAMSPPYDLLAAEDKVLMEAVVARSKQIQLENRQELKRVEEERRVLAEEGRELLQRGGVYQAADAEDDEENLPTPDRSVIVEAIVMEAIKVMKSLASANESNCFNVEMELDTMVAGLQHRYKDYKWSDELKKAASAAPGAPMDFRRALQDMVDPKQTWPLGDRRRSRGVNGPVAKRNAYDQLTNRAKGIGTKLVKVVRVCDTYRSLESDAFKEQRLRRERQETNSAAVPVAIDSAVVAAALAETDAALATLAAQMKIRLLNRHALIYPNQTANTASAVGLTLVDIPTYQNEHIHNIKTSAGPVDDSVRDLFSGLFAASNGTDESRYATKQKRNRYSELRVTGV
jgi:hypothetical protein